VIDGRRWWHLLALNGIFIPIDGAWFEVPAEAIEVAAAAMFLPAQLQLARKQVDPDGQKDRFLLDEQGRLRGLTERQARTLPQRTWAALLPPWLARQLLPNDLDAAEQAVLGRLLIQPSPLKREDAVAIAGCSDRQFRRIWRHYPEARKAPVGAPRGHRIPRKAPPLSRK
jgi:hypothetical protein